MNDHLLHLGQALRKKSNLVVPEKLDLDGHMSFWSEQMSEHALFLFLYLQDENLNDTAFSIHNEWEDLRKNELNVTNLSPMLKGLRSFKMDVLKKLKVGNWIGAVPPLFVDHIIRELDYIDNIIKGKTFTLKEDLKIWSPLIGEHAMFVSHFLDPTEKTLISKAKGVSEVFENKSKSEDLNKTNNSFLSLLKVASTNVRNGKISSILHPKLVDHVVREGIRFKQTLENHLEK